MEVNLVGRGVIAEPITMMVCDQAQREYKTVCEIQVVPLSQLYGGKICAARQHPRDLFDIKHLLANEGLTEEIKKGFLYCLLGSDRPIHEILQPNLLDHTHTMTQQFEGMTSESFVYEEYEYVSM